MGRAKPLAFNVEPRAPLREGVGGAWGAAHGLVRPRPGKKHESLPLETRREHVRRQSAVNRQRLGDVLASSSGLPCMPLYAPARSRETPALLNCRLHSRAALGPGVGVCARAGAELGLETCLLRPKFEG